MEESLIKLPRKKLRDLHRNLQKTARVINLVYVSGKSPGIQRVKRGKAFTYTKGKKIVKSADLERIKKLVIPPAWENVWICSLPNGHLQATGIDTKGRKQYRYHSDWNEFRNQTKFSQLLSFGKKLPEIRKQLEKDLAVPGLPLEKVLAAVVMVMQQTNIRVGNNMYEKLYGSFGLTTLKDNHVKIKGSLVNFSFRGKKGVYHHVGLKSKRLARIIRQCRDIPGKELFQYYDDQGARRTIDSGLVNDYLKKIGGESFTTKDFRTWMGTVYAVEAFEAIGCCETETETRKKIVEVLDLVAKRLGNTRAVCKKYYVHPGIQSMYADKSLQNFFGFKDKASSTENFSSAENLLMNILESI